jgi:hypothetical protein
MNRSHQFSVTHLFVILSEAKDLLFIRRTEQQVLRFAQDDNFKKGTPISRTSVGGCGLPRLRRQRAISFGTAIAIELPNSSHFLDHVKIEIGD